MLWAAKLEGGRVAFSGANIGRIEDVVVIEPSTLEQLTPDDGERYLRPLPYAFRSPYAHAVLIDADRSLLDEFNKAKNDIQVRCNKFVGALATELVRFYLSAEGIPTSERDVFIRGVDREFDLLITERRAQAKHGILYEPDSVVAVLEVKTRGAFGQSAVQKIKNDFERVRRAYPAIYCAYVSLSEREGYKWAVTESNLGFPAYTIYLRSGSGREGNFTGDWNRLVRDARRWIRHAQLPSRL